MLITTITLFVVNYVPNADAWTTSKDRRQAQIKALEHDIGIIECIPNGATEIELASKPLPQTIEVNESFDVEFNLTNHDEEASYSFTYIVQVTSSDNVTYYIDYGTVTLDAEKQETVNINVPPLEEENNYTVGFFIWDGIEHPSTIFIWPSYIQTTAN